MPFRWNSIEHLMQRPVDGEIVARSLAGFDTPGSASDADDFDIAGSDRDAVSSEIIVRLDHMGLTLAVSGRSQPGTGRVHVVGTPVTGDHARSAAGVPGPVLRLEIGEPDAVMQDLGRLIRQGDDTASAMPGSDPVVQRLSRALEAAESDGREFGGLYADAVRLAIVTRMLGMRAGQAENAAPPARQHRAKAALPKWRLARVKAYVDAHLSETVTLADMAAAAGLSRMHFAAQFRLATGIRPHEFILRRRIDRAMELLTTTSESLVGIALDVGFQTQAHFTTVFKRFVGDTPHQWRSANSRRN
ncbi:AraC-type DNA-binding protein [Pseudoxanthobacter soli DSM 19599]|uniref:AraC-type DNA-binding protein n=1 Tax=Pseudoxanthobacter soli DSM 19599 TaxID=1123029 RepID=A0A1M7Z7R6_9HYPH|nr:AraC family transcriptional regulator [Pseudoxanthobacter soli]SHO60884.1 AraC-type DNA-binding protein [Pseudoxanthobacter soli DSM 19599]